MYGSHGDRTQTEPRPDLDRPPSDPDPDRNPPWTQMEPPCEQMSICENITYPQTSFSGGNNRTAIKHDSLISALPKNSIQQLPYIYK